MNPLILSYLQAEDRLRIARENAAFTLALATEKAEPVAALRVAVPADIVVGEWYAQSGNNNSATRIALYSAINFCDRLNSKQKRGKSLAQKKAARKWANRKDF